MTTLTIRLIDKTISWKQLSRYPTIGNRYPDIPPLEFRLINHQADKPYRHLNSSRQITDLPEPDISSSSSEDDGQSQTRLTISGGNFTHISSGLERTTPGMERSASSATDLHNYRYPKKQSDHRSDSRSPHDNQPGHRGNQSITPDSMRHEECELGEDSLLDGFSKEQLEFLNADLQR